MSHSQQHLLIILEYPKGEYRQNMQSIEPHNPINQPKTLANLQLPNTKAADPAKRNIQLKNFQFNEME
jgi:hypothetical protein